MPRRYSTRGRVAAVQECRCFRAVDDEVIGLPEVDARHYRRQRLRDGRPHRIQPPAGLVLGDRLGKRFLGPGRGIADIGAGREPSPTCRAANERQRQNTAGPAKRRSHDLFSVGKRPVKYAMTVEVGHCSLAPSLATGCSSGAITSRRHHTLSPNGPPPGFSNGPAVGAVALRRAEVVGVDLQRRAVGILIGQARQSGPCPAVRSSPAAVVAFGTASPKRQMQIHAARPPQRA